MTVLYTSTTVLTVVCLTSWHCMPTQKHLSSCSLTSSSLTTLPSLVAYTERSQQHLTSQFFVHEVSFKKTEVLHQPAPLEEYRPPHITIGGTELKTVHQLTYLGCTITLDAKIDREVDNRLAKANSAFGRLCNRLWSHIVLILKLMNSFISLQNSSQWI